MPKKPKKAAAPHVVIVSEVALEAAINQYVETSLALLRRRAKQEKEIAALKAEHDLANKEDELQILSLEAGIQLFCITQRPTLFPDETKAKSKEIGNATVGFRLNPHAVSTIVKKDTWERVAERLAALEWGEGYVETKLSVDKEGLLKDRADLTTAQLAEAGIEITQGETFFIDPKSDLLEAARRPVESGVAA